MDETDRPDIKVRAVWKMKRVSASEEAIPIPPVARLGVVEVEVPLVGVAPEVERDRVAIRIALCHKPSSPLPIE